MSVSIQEVIQHLEGMPPAHDNPQVLGAIERVLNNLKVDAAKQDELTAREIAHILIKLEAYRYYYKKLRGSLEQVAREEALHLKL